MHNVTHASTVRLVWNGTVGRDSLRNAHSTPVFSILGIKCTPSIANGYLVVPGDIPRFGNGNRCVRFVNGADKQRSLMPISVWSVHAATGEYIPKRIPGTLCLGRAESERMCSNADQRYTAEQQLGITSIH